MIDPLTLIHGDCVDVMRSMDEATVDAIVTDPPYGLEFMGKEWDAPWRVAGFTQMGIEGHRRPTPAFGSARNPMCRTCRKHKRGTDRCVCVRSDFDETPRDASVLFQTWTEAWAHEALRVLKPGGYLLSFGGTRTYHRMTCAIEDAGFEVRDCIAWMYGSGFPKSLDVSKAFDKKAGAEREVVGHAKGVGSSNTASLGVFKPEYDATAPSTDLAKQWSGWGTALKPAFEPIVVARKPLIGTVAANVERYGTGALNIDGSRIGTDEQYVTSGGRKVDDNTVYGKGLGVARPQHNNGRWPANVILDEDAAAMLDEQSGDLKSGDPGDSIIGPDRQRNAYGKFGGGIPLTGYGDRGGASRFFYVAKASKTDRSGSTHPTVKPVELMRYLVRLVTPPPRPCAGPVRGLGDHRTSGTRRRLPLRPDRARGRVRRGHQDVARSDAARAGAGWMTERQRVVSRPGRPTRRSPRKRSDEEGGAA